MLYLLLVILIVIIISIILNLSKDKRDSTIKLGNKQNGQADLKLKQSSTTSQEDKQYFQLPTIYQHYSFLNTTSFGIFKNFNSSTQKRYTIAFNESPKNNYIIIKNDNIISHGEIPRLKKGLIADNGNFIISSWGLTSDLPGVFYAFNKSGDLILTESLKADIYNLAISDNGQFALCHSCKSKYDKYSKKIILFDLKDRKLLSFIDPIAGDISSYEFDLKKEELILNYKEQPAYRYSFNGEFIDQRRWDLHHPGVNLSARDVFDLMEERHKEELEELNRERLKEHLTVFKNLLETDLTEIKYRHARTYRYIAEIYLKLNQQEKALQYFTQALNISERVGVKRVTKRLKKELTD